MGWFGKLFGSRKGRTQESSTSSGTPSNASSSSARGASSGTMGWLYVRFDIDKLGGGAYGAASYRVLFECVPTSLLKGCRLAMGDSNDTLNGRENVSIIGLFAPSQQLEDIQGLLRKHKAFQAVGNNKPFQLTSHETEPLVDDGLCTGEDLVANGFSWAKATFDEMKKKNLLTP